MRIMVCTPCAPQAPRLWVALLALASLASLGRASSLTVPDDTPTIQAALDQRVDTVLVRPASYHEVPVISYQVYLSSSSEDANAPLPSLEGLYIVPARVGFIPRFAVSRLRFESLAYLRNDEIPCYMDFAGCVFRGGIMDLTEYAITTRIWLQRCEIEGGAQLLVDGVCVLDSCVVNGNLAVDKLNAWLFVRNCAFNGSGSGTAITAQSAQGCAIEGNTIRAFDFGMIVYGEDSVRVCGNVVSECRQTGIHANGNHISIVDNTVRECGIGVMAQTYTALAVTQNRVSGSREFGIYAVNADDVCRNVVWGSGLDGMHVGGSTRSVCENTTCLNGGSGIEAEFDFSSSVGRVTSNIGYGNGDVGIEWLTPNATIVACNEWYGNAMGAVRGRPESPEDLGVDPEFCDAAGRDFRLDSASPLVNTPGCGQIGALGVGCDVTATLVQRFAATRVTNGVRDFWEVAESTTASEIWLERSNEGPEGPWVRPATERSLEERTVVELDRSADPQRAYWYRLVANGAREVAVIHPPIMVEAQAILESRLTQIGPSPGPGPVRIAFALQHAAGFVIDVGDAQGRAVAPHEAGQ